MTHKTTREGFTKAAKRAHSGRVNPSAGAVGSYGSATSTRFGSNRNTNGSKTGGLKQEPRTSTVQKFGKRGS